MLIEIQLKDVNNKIEESAKKLNSPIFFIPGIGFYTEICILSEINDIHCFDFSRKIIGFAGIDPCTYQLRQYTAPTTVLSKQRSYHLHKAL